MREIKFRLTWREISSGRTLQTFVTLEQLLDHNEFTELTATNLIHNPEFELIAKDQFVGLNDKNGKDIYNTDVCKIHIFTQELGDNLGVTEGEKEFIGIITLNKYGVCINNEPLFAYYGFHEESLELI